jgi:DNA/RNA endonuclease YhcR with UshA esterase domain
MLKRSLFMVAALCALSLSSVHAQDDSKPTQKPKAEATKPQASVASKTAKFGSVKAGDGSVTKALKATDLAGAKKLIGKEAAFEGTVASVYTPKGNGLLILNFDKNYRNALTAVLRSKNYADFPDMQTLKGKRVLVTGKFEDYKGSAELVLTKPDQIKLITE